MADSFLGKTAVELYDKYGTELKNHCIVFPNRRAGLFFMKYLANKAGKPVWAPKITTINRLFANKSGLQIAPQEILVFELYKVFCTLSKRKENIDDFYFWGEMLLNDFDDVDKYLVEARALFTNLSDLHSIDRQFPWLTEEQIDIISKFIGHFNLSASNTNEVEKKFIDTWSVLYDLYVAFKQEIRKKGMAFEGMLCRDFVENEETMKNLLNRYDMFHFVGFNALNNCEKQLMRYLKTNNKARFYWDYGENMFLDSDRESDYFIKRNIENYGQDYIDNECSPIKEITITDIPSNTGQAKLLACLFKELNIPNDAENLQKTAVILADENLLPTVLSSIPEEINDVNITMGYAFNLTETYSLLKGILDIQKKPVMDDNGNYWFDYKTVQSILSNSVVSLLTKPTADNIKVSDIKTSRISSSYFKGNDFLQKLFTVEKNAVSLCRHLKDIFQTISIKITERQKENGKKTANENLILEFLFRANSELNILLSIFNDDTFTELSSDIFIRLIDRVFRSIKVPFSGEPLKGLQIMGLLESRTLDFDNVIFLSANEGVLPKLSANASYIPYNLRQAFGLPTITHQDCIFSYYFSRLLVRTKKVICVYNSSTDGIKSGEMSRFLLRIKYNKSVTKRNLSTNASIRQKVITAEEKEKTDADIAAMEKRFNKGISPSAMNDFLNCSMRFYYKYVCNIQEPKDIQNIISPAVLGTVFHDSVYEIYKDYINREITADIIEKINKTNIKGIIHNVIKRKCYDNQAVPWSGNALILEDIVGIYLKKVFQIDAQMVPFTMKAVETQYAKKLPFNCNGTLHELTIGGKIDRIDEKNSIKRLIDYKTGKVELEADSIKSIFDGDTAKRYDALCQLLTYCIVVDDDEICPAVYSLRNIKQNNIKLKAEDYTANAFFVKDDGNSSFSTIKEEVLKHLTETVERIFDLNTPFSMTSVEKRCINCAYRNLCGR